MSILGLSFSNVCKKKNSITNCINVKSKASHKWIANWRWKENHLQDQCAAQQHTLNDIIARESYILFKSSRGKKLGYQHQTDLLHFMNNASLAVDVVHWDRKLKKKRKIIMMKNYYLFMVFSQVLYSLDWTDVL